MENEGRKIMHHPAFRASVTCVRVPVYRAHSVAVSAEFENPVSVDAAREALRKAPASTWWTTRRRRNTRSRSMWPESTTAKSAVCARTARWRTGFAFGWPATSS